jgi:hypothetical protein
MTSAVAHRLQVWFTHRMPTTTKRRSRETTYEKAERILSDGGRVATLAREGQEYWLGFVVGDHGSYKVCALSEERAEALDFPPGKRLACRCRAGRTGVTCAHALVGEEMRLRGEA